MAYNILLVDDSSIVRKQLRRTIEIAGIGAVEVFEAENGKCALEVINAQWVDLVLLDVNMPVMNGVEFMKALCADKDNAQTPVVVFSTEGSEERLNELRQLGVKDVLRKPAQPEAIAAMIKRHLEG
jgi:two-component system chemotaxis response regulator CheY